MPIIPLKCPYCGGSLTVDSEKDAAICDFCRQPYIVKDAITKQYITNINNITADTVNVYSEKDFEIQGGKLVKYNGDSDHVVIPSTVKIIGQGVFAGMPISSVEIPDSVVEIGGNAFEGCSSLTSVTIPDSVRKIGASAFFGCSSLETAVLGSGIALIPYVMFDGCKSLASVSIPNGVQNIGAFAFHGCVKLNSVEIPESVESIGDRAFLGCNALTKVLLPSRLDKIGADAFSGTPFESELRSRSAERWKQSNLCRHCGGTFEGRFIKKCSKCGKPKDY